MTASELHRKLLYCGYNDLTDYLKNSPLNRYIYKQLLVLRPKHSIETPILTIFNEVYYQCIKIQLDRKPGIDVAERFFEEEAKWLGSRVDATLVFNIVMALEHKKCEKSFNDECFIEEMAHLLESCTFSSVTENLEQFIEQENIFIPYAYSPQPCDIKELPDFMPADKTSYSLLDRIKMWFGHGVSLSDRHTNAWKIITENFSVPYIEDYLRLYQDVEKQQHILLCIQHNFWTWKNSRVNFVKLKQNIEDGEYLQPINVILDSLKPHPTFDPDEDYDQMFAAGLRQTEEEAMNDKEEQYKQERDTLKYQLEQLKKNYEADLERIEAKYQDEIAALKKDLANKSSNKTKVEPKNDITPKELSLTISEIANDAKSWFHESGASELTNMLYRFARKQQNMDEDLWKLIDSIIPSVEKRTAPQTKVDIPSAGQVNINPQNVNNRPAENPET